jgi:hypothetical protein
MMRIISTHQNASGQNIIDKFIQSRTNRHIVINDVKTARTELISNPKTFSEACTAIEIAMSLPGVTRMHYLDGRPKCDGALSGNRHDCGAIPLAIGAKHLNVKNFIILGGEAPTGRGVGDERFQDFYLRSLSLAGASRKAMYNYVRAGQTRKRYTNAIRENGKVKLSDGTVVNVVYIHAPPNARLPDFLSLHPSDVLANLNMGAMNIITALEPYMGGHPKFEAMRANATYTLPPPEPGLISTVPSAVMSGLRQLPAYRPQFALLPKLASAMQRPFQSAL